LLINLAFITAFFRQLIVSTFDPQFSQAIGISTTAVHYGLMTLVSLTAVGAYDAVGSVLVVGFMVGPAIVGYMLSNDLKKIILIAVLSFVIIMVFSVILHVQH